MKSIKYCVCVVLGLLFFIIPTIAQDSIDNLPDLPGKIAYIGADYNVYTLDFTENSITQLSDTGERNQRFAFPTWSHEGQLAYFCCEVGGLESSRLEVYISADGVSKGNLASKASGDRHVYAYWSPVSCKVEEHCSDLAVLVQQYNQSELSVQLFNSANIDAGGKVLGTGVPFYYSWSPNGQSLVMHRNDSALEYYSVSSEDILTYGKDDLGAFFSPSWSPIDDRILYATQVENDISSLVMQSGETSMTIVEETEGMIAFSWSPDGNYIAYRFASSTNISPVYVVDAVTGEMVARSNIAGVIAFFWSPDSTMIAYITLSTPPGTFNIDAQLGNQMSALTQTTDGIAWNILQIENGENQLYASFIPSSEMGYLIGYFDQFSQSHSVWSPDSTHIVYSEKTSIDDKDSVITLLDITQPDTVPFSIVDGSFAVWSFN